MFWEIRLLNCEPVKIELSKGTVPCSVNSPLRVPFSLLQKVEESSKGMVTIEEVTTPADWCTPKVPTQNRNKEEIRVCVNLKWLNEGVKRECYILPTLDDITPKLAGAKVFQTLDTYTGFCHIPLETYHIYHSNG